MIPYRIAAITWRGSAKGIIMASLCCAFLLLSCGESPEIRSERTKLELAEMKGDLDMMFLSLRRLAELGDDSATSRLPQIRTAIKAREQMFQAHADHDHEQAIQAASELLYVAPEHKDGLRVLRESGQIFYYLREAQRLVSSALEETEPREIEIEPIVVDYTLDMSSSFRTLGPEKMRNVLITMKIQTLLWDLGHYYGKVDGEAGPETRTALKQFQEKLGKEGVLEISMETANKLQRALAEKQAQEEHIERRFHALARSRELTASAKALDPHFQGAVELDRTLEHAHTSSVYLLAQTIILSGTVAVGSSASIHDTVSSGLGEAAASRYDSIQDTWEKMSPLVDKARRLIKKAEDKMDSDLALVSSYESGSANELVSVLKEYAATVHNAVNALLVPTGSLIDFRRAGSEAVSQYFSANVKLTAAMPSSAQIQEDFDGLVELLKGYTIFKSPETEPIMDQHEELYVMI